MRPWIKCSWIISSKTSGVQEWDPNPLGIDHRDRTAGANPQAVGLRPQDERFRAGRHQFLEAFLQEFPGLQAAFLGSAQRRRLVGAKEDMTRR